ncbi:MAG TPA: hypothetical protein PKD42_16145, partial [Chitinophagaceae bacterium]|nr:hypothetical protein [Chitinophagaceae bacterium]
AGKLQPLRCAGKAVLQEEVGECIVFGAVSSSNSGRLLSRLFTIPSLRCGAASIRQPFSSRTYPDKDTEKMNAISCTDFMLGTVVIIFN